MTEPARMVRMVGEAQYRDQAEAILDAPGDASLVFRARPRSIVMACPDGCGETLVVNLDSRADKAWRFDMRIATGLVLLATWATIVVGELVDERLPLLPAVAACALGMVAWRAVLLRARSAAWRWFQQPDGPAT